MKRPVPDELAGIYDEKKYEEHCSYISVCRKFSRITNGIDTGLFVLFLITGVIGFVLDYFNALTGSHLWGAVMFIAVFSVLSSIYSLPFDYYSNFVIEERFGFNKSTKGTFYGDKIKSLFVSLLLICGIYAIVHILYDSFGANFWIFVFVIIVLFMVVMNMFYSQIIVPLFNKQTPLEDGELRDAIEKFARENNFKLKNIYVINGSKRSTKANAYFTGLSKTKRIVLYDTLIEQLSTEEIVAVLAHEVGHYKHHDIYKSLVLSVLNIGVYLFLFSFLAGNASLAEALGGTEASLLLSLIAFGLLLTPVSLVLSPILNYLSQKNEYNADNYAANAGLGLELISALKKLTANNLSPLQVHPLYVAFYYSHPTLLQRINNIKGISKK